MCVNVQKCESRHVCVDIPGCMCCSMFVSVHQYICIGVHLARVYLKAVCMHACIQCTILYCTPASVSVQKAITLYLNPSLLCVPICVLPMCSLMISAPSVSLCLV